MPNYTEAHKIITQTVRLYNFMSVRQVVEGTVSTFCSSLLFLHSIRRKYKLAYGQGGTFQNNLEVGTFLVLFTKAIFQMLG